MTREKGTGLIQWFVRNRYFWEQGERVLSISNAIPVRDILLISASGMWILEKVGINAEKALPFVLLYYIGSALLRWEVGKFWHKRGGYSVETRWNWDKVPPGRTVVVNFGELKEILNEMARRGNNAS